MTHIKKINSGYGSYADGVCCAGAFGTKQERCVSLGQYIVELRTIGFRGGRWGGKPPLGLGIRRKAACFRQAA